MCFRTVAWLGPAAAGTVPAPLPQGALAVHPSAPCGVKAAQVVIPCPPVLPVASALLLACCLGRQLDPSRTLPRGLLQLVLPARTDSAPGAFWSWQHGSPASSDGVGHPQPHASPARAAPVLANGPLGLLAAGLVLGLHRDRDTNLQLSGGCWGVKEQSMATLAVLMTWFEMRILHLSGFPLYF